MIKMKTLITAITLMILITIKNTKVKQQQKT